MSLDILFLFPLFILGILLAFFIPGNIVVARLELSQFQKITLSLSLGIVLWALQGFLFGFLHIRWMTYGYILITTALWLKTNWHTIPKLTKLHIQRPSKHSLLLSLFILVILISQLLTTFANGVMTKNGLYFCCGVPDSLFHTALTNELVTTFPPHEPGLSGIQLQNYHFLPNLVNADLIRIFHIPLLHLQYPYTSLFITLLFALNVITFSQLVTKNRLFTWWLLFFVFFSGDILYLLTYIKLHTINFQTGFLENAAWLWISPPRVYGALILFTGISFLILWIRSKRNTFLEIAVIATLGSLIGFKVYFAVFALAGMGILGLMYLKEKAWRRIVTVSLTFLLSFILFFPINSGAGGFVFTGFWRFENFAAQPNFGLQQMELARYVYLEHNNWLRVLQHDLIYVAYYFIFVFGTLLIAFAQTRKSLSQFSFKIHLFLLTGFVACLLLGSFFIQKTGGANSSQFLMTVMIMMPIYTALAVSYWLTKFIKNKVIMIGIATIIIIFTIPRVVYENINNVIKLQHVTGLTISNEELEALYYLRDNLPKDAVTLQYNQSNCIYFSFIAQRESYACIDGAPSDRAVKTLDERMKFHEAIFKEQSIQTLTALSTNKTIDYLYLPTMIYTQKEKVFKKYKIYYKNADITVLKII